jgi:hypothetical protein
MKITVDIAPDEAVKFIESFGELFKKQLMIPLTPPSFTPVDAVESYTDLTLTYFDMLTGQRRKDNESIKTNNQ